MVCACGFALLRGGYYVEWPVPKRVNPTRNVDECLTGTRCPRVLPAFP